MFEAPEPAPIKGSEGMLRGKEPKPAPVRNGNAGSHAADLDHPCGADGGAAHGKDLLSPTAKAGAIVVG